ncbi:MAG: murein hydrolase activator EnvC [Granulosicoccus sp.]
MGLSTRHKLSIGLLTLLCASLTSSLQAENAKNIDELAQQIQQTDEQLKALKQTIDRNIILKRDLQAAFKAASEKRGEREQRLAELDGRITEFNKRLEELEKGVASAANDIENRKNELAKSLRSSQNIGAASELKTLLQHDNPAQAQRLDVYRSYFFEAQQRQVRSATEFLYGVEQARLTTLKDRNWLNHIREKATSQRETFARDAQAKRHEIDSIEQILQDSTRTVAQLQQDQQRLQSLMEELESLQRGGSGYFAALKGQYALPVAGKITARFGETKSVGKVRWNGLYISAREGDTVRAVADGEVVYSDWLQGFGMLVILDHGDGYMTLYGGNRSVMPLTGSWVESGSTIAKVGDSGGQNTSGLYFEIRHNATALDPQDWLKPASSL